MCLYYSSRVFCHSNRIESDRMQTYTNKPIKRINIYICIYPSRFRFLYTRKAERARLRSCAKRVSDVLNTCDFLNCHAVSWRDRRRRGK